MATLMRPAPAEEELERDPLSGSVPAPFPVAALAASRSLHPTVTPRISSSKLEARNPSVEISPPSLLPEVEQNTALLGPQSTTDEVDQPDIRPSITHVQQSCIMSLNTLLSNLLLPSSTPWRPILPSRRHSMPSTLEPASSETALATLVSNLRARDTEMSMIASTQSDETELVRELADRLDQLGLSGRDAELTKSLVSLLKHTSRLAQIAPNGLSQSLSVEGRLESEPLDSDIYDTLSRQVQDLQLHRETLATSSSSSSRVQVSKVEQALLWRQIDSDLATVLTLCRERAASPNPFADQDHLPPDYHQYADHLPEYQHNDPQSITEKDVKDSASIMTAHTNTFGNLSEKMRMDLESVTMAIDRLYMVAPQLHSQRVELKKSKLEQMERARRAGDLVASGSRLASGSTSKVASGNVTPSGSRTRAPQGKGKGKNKQDMDDLDNILGLLGKASSRRLDSQSVIVGGDGMGQRLEKAKLRDEAQREEFVINLMSHSDARRLHSQDAVLQPQPRIRNPDAMLTLPEFIRESHSVPISRVHSRNQSGSHLYETDTFDLSDNLLDPEGLLTLPEFVREQEIKAQKSLEQSLPTPVEEKRKSLGKEEKRKSFGKSTPTEEKRRSGGRTPTDKDKPAKSRTRSLSAPGTWLKGVSSKVPAIPLPEREDESMSLRAGLDVQYVAEHQDTLSSVIVLLSIPGIKPPPSPSMSRSSTSIPAQPQVEADVPPSGQQLDSGGILGGDRLVLRCGASWSAPLSLPTRVVAGKQEVNYVGDHLEIRLKSFNPSDNGAYSRAGETPLWDATQLGAMKPTSFICSSCSLPIAYTTSTGSRSQPTSPFDDDAQPDFSYSDLPSEHWAELLEAWMCHPDQKLSKDVQNATAASNLSTNHTASNTGGSNAGWIPGPGRVLVGGSYILFDESAVVRSNVRIDDGFAKHGDDWHLVKCICGSTVGRSKTTKAKTITTYRLTKYAVRPVSQGVEPTRLPLSAFIVEDMMELVHAHASYRFIISDEEEEKPRLLVWMFKPNLRITYAIPRPYLIGRSGSILASKILFKAIAQDTTDLNLTLDKYPGFSQAEHLYYPLDICRRLMGILKESNSAYPEAMRTLTELDVGWLQHLGTSR